MFGTKKEAVMIAPSQKKRLDKDKLLAQIISNGIDLSNTNGESFYENYQHCIRKGIDPSSQMYGSDTVRTFLSGKGGALDTRRFTRGSLRKIKEIVDSMKSDVIDSQDSNLTKNSWRSFWAISSSCCNV